MSACLHPRRWFFRQRLRFVNRRPLFPVVERCLDCHELTRTEVPPKEIQEAVMSSAALEPDRWEDSRG